MHQATTDSGLRIGELAERAGLTLKDAVTVQLEAVDAEAPARAAPATT